MLRVGATHLLRVVTHFANRGFLWNEQNLGVHWGFIYLIFIHAGLKHLSNVWREGCFSRKPIMRSLFLFLFFLKKINNLEERITGGSWRCRMANCREDLWSLIVLQYAGSKGFSHAAHKLKDQLRHETMPCFYSLKYFAVCHSVK